MGGFFEQLSIVSLAVVACVVIARLTRGLGMVSGVAYLLLGILIGSTGVLPSLSPYAPLTGTGAAALMSMLLFVSGYSTNLQGTRRLWPRAALLGIGATLITIAAVGACLHLLLGVSLPVAVIVACAVGCTDIASVIGTLRGHGLTLRRDPAIMVELESGLSAPTSFVVLNVAMLFLGTSAPDEGWLALPQQIGQSALALVITLAAGLVIAALAIWAARLLDRHGGQTGPAFITAVALISVALPESMGGSGCLCAWFVGLALGNARLEGTHQVVHFFDGLTFLLVAAGLVAFGTVVDAQDLLACVPVALLVFALSCLVARPLATLLCLARSSLAWPQRLFVSLFAPRGPSTLCLALVALTGPGGSYVSGELDLAGIALVVVALSLCAQAALAPRLARVTETVARGGDSSIQTFTDYEAATDRTLVELRVHQDGWAGRTIGELGFSPEELVVLVRRGDEELVPMGSTLLEADDVLIMSMPSYVRRPQDSDRLVEVALGEGHPWARRRISELGLPADSLVVLVRRAQDTLVPNGSTELLPGDVLVFSGTPPVADAPDGGETKGKAHVS